jgi:Domain of unknown function (DUF5911)
MDRYPNISDHGLIGDLQTAALVTTDGTLDWFCCPRFDSPSVSESAFSAWPAALSFFVTRRRPVPAELVAAGPGSSRSADTADRGAARSAGARKEGAR